MMAVPGEREVAYLTWSLAGHTKGGGKIMEVGSSATAMWELTSPPALPRKSAPGASNTEIAPSSSRSPPLAPHPPIQPMAGSSSTGLTIPSPSSGNEQTVAETVGIQRTQRVGSRWVRTPRASVECCWRLLLNRERRACTTRLEAVPSPKGGGEVGQAGVDRRGVAQPGCEGSGDSLVGGECPATEDFFDFGAFVAASDDEDRSLEDCGFFLDATRVGDQARRVADEGEGEQHRVVERFGQPEPVREVGEARGWR